MVTSIPCFSEVGKIELIAEQMDTVWDEYAYIWTPYDVDYIM